MLCMCAWVLLPFPLAAVGVCLDGFLFCVRVFV